MPRIQNSLKRQTPAEIRNDIRRQSDLTYPQPCDCTFFGRLPHQVKNRYEKSNHRKWQAKQDAVLRWKRVHNGSFQPEDADDSSTLIGDSSPDPDNEIEEDEDGYEDLLEPSPSDAAEDSNTNHVQATRRNTTGHPKRPFISSGNEVDTTDNPLTGTNLGVGVNHDRAQGLEDFEDDPFGVLLRFNGIRAGSPFAEPTGDLTSASAGNTSEIIQDPEVEGILRELEITDSDDGGIPPNDRSDDDDNELSLREVYRNLNRELLKGTYIYIIHINNWHLYTDDVY